MKLQNDEDEFHSFGIKMPTIIMAASAAIFVVLAIVLIANGTGKKKNHPKPIVQDTTVEESSDSSSNRTADDLNFWNMYKPSDGETILSMQQSEDENRKTQLEQREADMLKAEQDAIDAAKKEAEENPDPSQDGKHTLVMHNDGTTEWVSINSSIGLNNFEDTQFQSKNGFIEYAQNGRASTKTGVDISQYTTNIDWNRLATEVDYCMIRVGARGYDSGQIIADTKFIENVVGAYKTGIPFGIYFSSQAITEDEARAEAEYVLSQLAYANQVLANPGMWSSIAANQINGNSGNQNNIYNNTNSNNYNTNNANNNTNNNNSGVNNTNNTTTTTDAAGNTITVTYDPNGNVVTTTKEPTGRITSKLVYPNGNSVTTVSAADGKLETTTVVVTDATGKTTTTVTDTNGNTISESVTQGPAPANNAGNTNNGSIANPNGVNTTNATGQNNTNKLQYPIAVDMHQVTNDVARIDSLNNATRTTILNTFCDTIEKAGYDSVVCANKEFLICKVNLAAMTRPDIWMVNDGDLPDYPYNFSMWRYSSQHNLLKSLSGDYGVDMSFIDYSLR